MTVCVCDAAQSVPIRSSGKIGRRHLLLFNVVGIHELLQHLPGGGVNGGIRMDPPVF